MQLAGVSGERQRLAFLGPRAAREADGERLAVAGQDAVGERVGAERFHQLYLRLKGGRGLFARMQVLRAHAESAKPPREGRPAADRQSGVQGTSRVVGGEIGGLR